MPFSVAGNAVNFNKPLIHGGDLQRASAEFGEPKTGWIDLSTGVSPWAWPVPELPTAVWRDLPNDNAALLKAAGQYYQCSEDYITAGAGSQVFIQSIPRHVVKARVAIPFFGYQEHAKAWAMAGHDLVFYQNFSELEALLKTQNCKHVVVINPNNPTAEIYTKKQLLRLYDWLTQDGVLLIDEAFADVDATNSMTGLTHLPNLYVLRSIGKFFGLAGLRLGFCLSSQFKSIHSNETPWSVSHPAQWIGVKALADKQWQGLQRQRLLDASNTWCMQLKAYFYEQEEWLWSANALFVSVIGRKFSLRAIYEKWAKKGILLRYIEGYAKTDTACLRFALPGEKIAEIEKALKERLI